MFVQTTAARNKCTLEPACDEAPKERQSVILVQHSSREDKSHESETCVLSRQIMTLRLDGLDGLEAPWIDPGTIGLRSDAPVYLHE